MGSPSLHSPSLHSTTLDTMTLHVDIRGYTITALSPSVSPGVWRWHHNYWLSHSEVIHNNPSPDALHTSAGEATVIVQRLCRVSLAVQCVQ